MVDKSSSNRPKIGRKANVKSTAEGWSWEKRLCDEKHKSQIENLEIFEKKKHIVERSKAWMKEKMFQERFDCQIKPKKNLFYVFYFD